MSIDTSPTDLVKETEAIERMLEDVKKPPRTFAERVFASGADLLLAIAFFALGLTANLIANLIDPGVSPNVAFFSAFAGLVVLKYWSFVREHESLRDELSNLARDARLTRMIVDLTVDALAKRQHASRGSRDSSDGSESEAVPANRAP